MKTKLLTKSMAAALLLTATAFGQGLPAGIKEKVESRAKQLQALSTDPQIVSAVKAHNANQTPEEKAMTNEK